MKHAQKARRTATDEAGRDSLKMNGKRLQYMMHNIRKKLLKELDTQRAHIV